MPIDPTKPADNALVSTLPAYIREARAEVSSVVALENEYTDEVMAAHIADTDPHTQYVEPDDLGSAAFEDSSAFDSAGTASSLVAALSDVYEPKNANIQSHLGSTSNPHSVTAEQVGLGNVTNESKATLFTNPTFTGAATIPGGTINNTTIGATTPAAGAFTTLSATGVTSHPDGTVSAPAISFTSDTNTGIYRIGADNLGIACNGAKVADVGTTGLAVTGAVSTTGNATIGLTAGAVWNIGKALELGYKGVGLFTTGPLQLIHLTNAYYNSGWKYAGSGGCTSYEQTTTAHIFGYAIAGTADAATTIIEIARLNSTGLSVTGTIKGSTIIGVGNATPAASGAGITFPATQSASSDANTLDDYEEGTWTPSITFDTAGDLSVSYSKQVGTYTKIGRLVTVTFNIITSAFTHTTASGNLRIHTMPFAPSATYQALGSTVFQGITKANYTNYAVSTLANNTYAIIEASGSGQAVSIVGASNTPTGSTIVLYGTMSYEV